MIAFAALLLTATPGQSPDRALLDAFATACSRITDVGHAVEDARAAAWAEVAPDSDPRLDRLAGPGRRRDEHERAFLGKAFRRTIAGQDYFLIISRWEDEVEWRNDCRLYHFGAAAPVDPEVLESWLGRAPMVRGLPGVVTVWVPEWRPGIGLAINHVAANALPGAQIVGNVLVAQASGSNR